MEGDVWDENSYKNWVRGAKGLEFLQEGLQTFVGDKAPEVRDQQLQSITKSLTGFTPQCSQCTSNNLLPDHAQPKKACDRFTCIQQQYSNCFGSKPWRRRKCPNGICSKLYDAIVDNHRFRDPLWKNTDPTTWCTDPQGWSFMKCFETTPEPGTSAKNTDASGLISILINNLSMQNWLACHMGKQAACLFYESRCIRNDILHKPKMELEDLTLDRYIDTFIAVLKDPKCLLTYAGSQDAVNKLTQLKAKQINVSQDDVENIMKKRKDALSEIEERQQEAKLEIDRTTASGLTSLTQTKTQALQEMQDTTSYGVTTIASKATDALQEMQLTSNTGVIDLTKTKTEAVSEIQDTASIGVTELTKISSEAVRKIQDTTGSGVTEVNKTKKEAFSEIQDTTRSGVTEVTKTTAEASRDIQDIIRSGVTKVTKTKTEAVSEIKDTTSIKVAEVTNTATEAVRKIQETTGSGVTEVNKTKTEAVSEIQEVKSNILEELKEQQISSAASARTEPLTPTDVKVQKTPGRVDRFFNRFKNALGFGLQRDLQNDLIEFYRRHHTNIPLSPLIEKDTPLLEFYVMPDIKSVKRAWGGGEEEKTLVSPFRSVFYEEKKICKEIYLTADAGLGKTAFSKRLALTWCHAKKPLRNEKRFFSSHEEIQVMNEFCFVFLVLLRDSFSECDIDDLIFDQIISRLASTYTFKDIENILRNEKCLVILEGLDEWCHPSNSCKQRLSSIPHRTKMSTSLTVLTTTRPWKLSVSGLHSSQIDKHLEIIGLNQKMANKLKKSVISHMYSEKNDRTLEQHAEKFTIAMKEKRISDLEAVPLLLMYLLFLWKCNIDLGHSQSELYSGIIELLFSRTAPIFKDMPLTAEHAQGEIPHCLTNRMHCRQFYTLMTALGQLAFRTLFNETKEENTLVFDSSTAEQYLSKECLIFCRGTGIITQSNVQGELLEKKSKVSYAHKTVQEYFAALYMFSTPSQTSVPEIVLSKCKCLKDILDMSKVLMFISGINVNVSSLISRELMRIINDDEITDIYRSTFTPYVFTNPLKQFQDMCILCCKEFPHENVDSFCLQDVFIDESCQQEQYRENLKQLTTRNKQNIKSLHIHMYIMRKTPYNSAQKVIEYFELRDLENIEKVKYDGEYDDDILPLLNSSVKCLSLSCRGSFWSRLLLEKVTSLQKLEAMNINGFSMSHSELTFLFDYMSQKHCMREIRLQHLRCTDHRRSCTACLDLSQHFQLRKLTLDAIPMSELKINMASLEECGLRRFDNPELVLRFVNCVTADNKLNKFMCRQLEYSAAIETMMDTLRLSVHVKHVELWGINLGNRELPLFSEMVNIERVGLIGVTMPASVFRGLVDSVHKLPHTVRVGIVHCNIKPGREFKTEKNKIKKSQHFRVLDDFDGWFRFVTCNN